MTQGFQKLSFQTRPHSEVLEVRAPTHEFRGNTIQPIMAKCRRRTEVSNEQGGQKNLKGFLREAENGVLESGLLGGKRGRRVFL